MNKLLGILIIALFTVQFASALSADILSTDPAPLQAGDFADITVQVEASINEDIYEYVDVSILQTPYVRQVSSNNERINKFKPGSSATKTFRVYVEDTLPQGYIDLDIQMNTDRGSFKSSVRVFVQKADSKPEIYIGRIKTTPQELLPDTDDNKLTITLQNLGDKDAELVNAQLVTDSSDVSASYSFSLEDNVASIKSGSQQDLTFTIDLDENATGQIPASLHLRYRSESASGETYETLNSVIPFTIDIIDAPLLKIVSVEQLDDFSGGTVENRVRVGIKNEGTDDADEVRVRIIPDISYPFLFETTTEYVSSKIKPGETAYVQFKTEVTNDAQQKEYPITAKLESLVGETRYTREDVLKVNTQPGKSVSIGTVGFVIIIVVILVAGVIGIRTFMSRKKRPTQGVRRNTK